MKKVLVGFMLLLAGQAKSKEGMWIPSLLNALNESDMKTMGMQLSADDLYSVNHSSLKDAIVHFNGGCTAELISSEGLLLTNHHCGYSAIQSHSSLEHNYLSNGFWAKTKADELANPGMVCTFIVKIEDVTEELISSYRDLSDNNERLKAYQTAYKRIVARETNNDQYGAVIKPFNYGNAFFVIVTETFKDIRLVGAPPNSVGKFGGDTDNWVWPRHTGDFSMFRIYADGDNKPAGYSKDNVPLKPRHYLPVSMEDRNEGDFSMVYGFPGTTEQYLIAAEVDYRINKELPKRIAMRDQSLDVINSAMRDGMVKGDTSVFIKYASKQARIANGWKKWIGQIGGLNSFRALDKKRALEKEYLKLAYQKDEYKPYRGIIAELEELYKGYHKIKYNSSIFIETYFVSGPELLPAISKYASLLVDTLSINEISALYKDSYLKSVEGFWKNYEPSIDKERFKRIWRIYLDDDGVDLTYLPISSRRAMESDLDKYIDDAFEKSIFTNKSMTTKMLSSYSSKWRKKILKDPLYKLSAAMRAYYNSKLKSEGQSYGTQEIALMRDFVKGLMEMMPDKKYWYDANSTLRLTYGKVEGSSPRDGMQYKYYTTMDGVLAKYDPKNADFELPKRLIELGEKRDYGPYAQDGELFVCFTGSNHTTGGNSGSPCINAEGHLIGLNFDRSWESTMSDIMFDPDICRNIMVDIRYVLFIVDKFAGAKHLVDEMTLVTPEWRETQRNDRFKNKIKTLSEEIKKDAKNPEWLVQRAAYYDSLGLKSESVNDIEAALNLDKKNPSAVLAKTEILLENGKKAEAVKLLGTAIRYNRGNAELHFRRGVVYVEMKQYIKAVSDFDRVISIDGTHFRAYYDRGVCFHLTGKYDKACRDIKMAQSLGGNKEFFIYESICE